MQYTYHPLAVLSHLRPQVPLSPQRSPTIVPSTSLMTPASASKQAILPFSDNTINALAGGIAGGLTAVFVCPLDVLKTRLQLQRTSHLQKGGIAGGLTSIVKEEGMKGLYRGLGPTLLALLPNWAVYFTVYDKLKHTLVQRPGGEWRLILLRLARCSIPPSPSGVVVKETPAVHMCAAACAGAATLLVTNPFWVVKTRMQTQTLTLKNRPEALLVPYTGTFNALSRITREEGIHGLYSGIFPSMAGILHVAIQFPLYEFCKTSIAQRTDRRTEDLTAAELVLASSVSKMCASTATYPHEVVRSYMHVSKSGGGHLQGLKDACRTIFKEDGVRGFYRGCATNLLRTTPAAALTFTSFELIVRFIKS